MGRDMVVPPLCGVVALLLPLLRARGRESGERGGSHRPGVLAWLGAWARTLGVCSWCIQLLPRGSKMVAPCLDCVRVWAGWWLRDWRVRGGWIQSSFPGNKGGGALSLRCGDVWLGVRVLLGVCNPCPGWACG